MRYDVMGGAGVLACSPALGVRMVCEQVSHHPPMSAFHCESTLEQLAFTLDGHVHPRSLLLGRVLVAQPRGIMTLTLHSYARNHLASLSPHPHLFLRVWRTALCTSSVRAIRPARAYITCLTCSFLKTQRGVHVATNSLCHPQCHLRQGALDGARTFTMFTLPVLRTFSSTV